MLAKLKRGNMNREVLFMQRCLDLAVMGAGKTSPNPMVGAVIVHDGKIIGEGYTSPYGGPHAEVNAIQDAMLKFPESAEKLFQESTIYVSLEPCAHFGKTPPCADLIVSKKFKKAVIACQDPFAKVNGLGIQKLKEAGIEVVIGVLEKEAKWVNRRFFTRLKDFRPYIILKWAETKDGYFAPADGSQKWISNAASKQLVHQWRTQEDAILVGKGTALADNPSLTAREWSGRNPKRVLIDKRLEISRAANLYSTQADTIVFNAEQTDWQGNIKLIALENFDLYLPQQVLYQLYLMDIQSLIVEGGKKTLEQFIQAGLWDEARIFKSSENWGAGMEAPKINGSIKEKLKVGSDTLEILIKP